MTRQLVNDGLNGHYCSIPLLSVKLTGSHDKGAGLRS